MAGNNVRRWFAGDTRKCARKCGQVITVTDQMTRTSTYYCSGCRSRASVESAKRHIERKRRTNAAYSRRHSGSRSTATAKWRANHPLKRLAHQAVQTAIRNGTLARKPCELCSGKAQAHHDDYGKPLEVRWLCHGHHMEHHAMLKAREGK